MPFSKLSKAITCVRYNNYQTTLHTVAHHDVMNIIVIFSYGISLKKNFLATLGLEPASQVSVDSLDNH